MPFNSILRKRCYVIFSITTLLIIISVVILKLVTGFANVNYLGEYRSESQFGVYKKYAVSTDSAQCAHIGKQILELNGTAGDAAIAVLLCMGVTIPHSMGLGGGCLILYYNSTNKQFNAIDAREEAPKNTNKDLFLNVSDEYRHPLSIGVPGELAGYWELHQKFGRLKWSQLFDGAISLSKNGFIVSKHLADALKYFDIIDKKSPFFRDFFVNNFSNKTTNELYKEGNKITNKKLAKTLEMLANSPNPMNLFYDGLIKDYIIEDIQELIDKYNMSSVITAEDFQNYKPRTNVEPVKTSLKRGNYTFSSFPLPGSGGILALILKVMEQFDDLYPNAGQSLDTTILFYHRLIETFKFAYSQRTLLGDNDVVAVPVMANLTSDAFAANIRNLIDDTKTYPIESGRYGDNIHITEDKGTAHVSVVDKDGNAVAVTTTINSYFGSLVMSKRTGLILNDELFDFKLNYRKYKLPANETNLLGGGKRPLSSMCPTIITDSTGRVRLVIGASGGTKITNGIAQVVIRQLWLGEDIKQAIDAPRVHHQFSPDHIIFEKQFPKLVLNGLANLGHKLTPLRSRGAIVMAISANKKRLFANSDYRKGGDVDGL